MLSFAYRLVTDLGAPFIGLYLLKRRAEGREDSARFPERFGIASHPRPEGRLVWCHAASVGEAASVLSLLDKLRALYPSTQFLVTTGTVTSARLMAARLPPAVMHQYMPVDRAPYAGRFLDHWKPDFALWIESELWPNMLNALRRRKIPAVLLNGRMSEKSFHRWYRYKGWARELLSTFSLCLTQTEDERGRFVALGARPVRCFGNLKFAADPLPADEQELARLRTLHAGRPLWLMASTHRGEEEMALEAHKRLREKWPNLLTIIVPRHAHRGQEVGRKIEDQGLTYARRSQQQPIGARTQIYLADTMGELGLFYRLAPFTALGGSFVPVGGHNPIEPAQLGCMVIFGPSMHNFSEIAREFVIQQAALQLPGGNELAYTIDRFLSSPAERGKYVQSAKLLADQKRHVLDQVTEALKPWFGDALKRAA